MADWKRISRFLARRTVIIKSPRSAAFREHVIDMIAKAVAPGLDDGVPATAVLDVMDKPGGGWSRHLPEAQGEWGHETWMAMKARLASALRELEELRRANRLVEALGD